MRFRHIIVWVRIKGNFSAQLAMHFVDFIFSIPLWAGVLVTIMDTLVFLFLDKYGRKILYVICIRYNTAVNVVNDTYSFESFHSHDYLFYFAILVFSFHPIVEKFSFRSEET